MSLRTTGVAFAVTMLIGVWDWPVWQVPGQALGPENFGLIF